MSSVVYARVPDPLKQALAARARERGLSVTAAVVALLERGLDASEEERGALGGLVALALASTTDGG